MAIRPAVGADRLDVEELDRRCFPSEAVGSEPAAPGELQAGIDAELLLVAEDEGRLVGFVQGHLVRGERLLVVAGLGVDPSARGAGVGRRLLDALLSSVGTHERVAEVVMTVAPDNEPMLRLVLGAGFVATGLVRDYFGPGTDRLQLRLDPSRSSVVFGRAQLVPTGHLVEVQRLLAEEDWIITGIDQTPHGPCFVLQRSSLSDLASVTANESSVSVAFASVVIGALAFLIGFGFVKDGFPVDLLSQLSIALIASLISLIVYANSTGELSAFRFDRFSEYMEIGNIVSEFGGVYPLLLVVPVAVASITGRPVAGLVTCVGSAVAILLYQRSPFDILDRYNDRPWMFGLFTAFLVVSPVIGFASDYFLGTTWPWSVLNVVVLLLIAGVCLRRSGITGSDRPDRID